MTDPIARMASVRGAIAEQHAKLPAVDHNGQPLAPPLTDRENDYVAMLRDDETWKKMGPGWEEHKRYWEAKAAGQPVSPILPELDGSLTPQQRELAAALENGVMSTAQSTAPAMSGTPRPDPSQGGSGGGGGGLDAHIAEAQKAGKWRDVISLQRQQMQAYGGGTR